MASLVRSITVRGIARPLSASTSRRSVSSSLPRRASVEPVTTFDPRVRLFVRQRDFLRRHRFLRLLAITGTTIGVIGASCGICVLGLFAYDATTYSEEHVDKVPVNPLALTPERGGVKNLKIAKFLVDDEEDEATKALESKPKLVVIGGGWGSVALLKQIDPAEYHVVVVAPENYFLFTPLLPSATVGTVELRTLVEPLRKIIARAKGHYLQGKVVDIDMGERLLEVSSSDDTENYYIPYDKVVVAVGSISNDHGVPGLEYCHQLKTVSDVQSIRRKILDNLERACLPTTTSEERRRLLSFAISGGGPTGCEQASEIFDFVNEDMLKYFPKLLRNEFKLTLIQSRDHILNTYSEKISKYAEERFKRAEIDTVLNARVKEVTPTSITYTDKVTGQDHTLATGFVLWSTGIAMNPLTKIIANHLPNQYHKHALEVDSHLRVIGAPLGTVYAIGDASTVETNLVNHLLELVDTCDVNGDGKIDFEEFEKMMKLVRRKFPTSQLHIEKVRDVFTRYDKDHDDEIGLNELTEMFQHISQRLTSLPATAQVANQQGKYLANKLTKIAKSGSMLELNHLPHDVDDAVYTPFSYKHLGSLAYIGNSAVFDFGSEQRSFAGGLIASYLWRSIYWSEQVSTRTRLLLMIDWVKRGIWGRDVSKF